MPPKEIQFCPYCGVNTQLKEAAGKTRPCCPACGWIYFPDPKVGTAVLVIENGSILLVRRKYQPHAGLWALPAGFVDAFEDPKKAAQRECLEETGLEVEITGLLAVLSGREHPRGADIMIAYCARITAGSLKPGDDAEDACFFPMEHLPPVAFETTKKALVEWRNRAPCLPDPS